MKITICGSMHHIKAIKGAAKTLTELGYDVVTPNPREGEADYDTLSDTARASLKETLIQEHLDHINTSDAILVFNEDKKGVAGYIGGNTLMEMAFAFAQKIELFLLQPAPDMSYTDEDLGMQPINLHGDIMKIHEYFLQLPVTYVSSESPIKLAAVSRGMRRAGLRTRVVAQATDSKVSEQPMSAEETYKGAMNRHEALAKSLKDDVEYSYLATIESGLQSLHPQHGLFDCSVIIIEKQNIDTKIGISTRIEYPKPMTDMIPAKYADVGVLVQSEYGSKLKDPIAFLTNHKMTRREVLEDAVSDVAIQLP